MFASRLLAVVAFVALPVLASVAEVQASLIVLSGKVETFESTVQAIPIKNATIADVVQTLTVCHSLFRIILYSDWRLQSADTAGLDIKKQLDLVVPLVQKLDVTTFSPKQADIIVDSLRETAPVL